MPWGFGPWFVPYTRPAGGWRGRWAPPRVLHEAAPVEHWTRPVTAHLDQSAAVVLNANGAGFVQLAPDGLSTWRIRLGRVRTTTGPPDSAQCLIYQTAIVDHRHLAETSQGGADTFDLDVAIRPGDTLIALWSGGSPGDTATFTVYGTVHTFVPG